MLRILLVEDEPSAMKLLQYIIENRCTGFTIAGTAENGLDGLEKIRLLKPDIVITDVRMPIMDGIELASHVKKEFPGMYCIVVSGYHDFEYARGALQSGVVDYLLKPVNAGQLQKLLSSLKEKIEESYHKVQLEILKKIYNQGVVEKAEIKKYIPYEHFTGAIIRENRLPARFRAYHSAGFIYEDIKMDDLWIFQGRDEVELIILHPYHKNDENSFEELVSKVREALPGNYYITISASKPFELMELRRVVSDMCKVMDNNIVIGTPQVIHDSTGIRPNAGKKTVLDGTTSNMIDFYVSNGMYNELKQEMIKLFDCWEKEKFTQLWIENILRQILKRIEKLSVSISRAENYDMEFLLDEALAYCTSLGELMANVWDIITRVVQHPDLKAQKLNTPDFFETVEQYIAKNLSESLSLQNVCSVFGISQTYMSKLFRKYRDMSYNEYITSLKVEKAKQIIAKNPDLPIKDVAELVGFNDPFYFSRVFRSITGMPPSQYSEEQKGKAAL